MIGCYQTIAMTDTVELKEAKPVVLVPLQSLMEWIGSEMKGEDC